LIIAPLALLCAPLVIAASPPTPAPSARLPAQLRTAIARAGLVEGQLSLVAIFSDETVPFATLRAHDALLPASTHKLLVTSCALEHLGPTKVFTTTFRAAGRPDAAGRLGGDLAVEGGGDTLLRGEELWAAVRELKALGLQEVRGDVLIDDGLFARPGRPNSWPRRRVSDPFDATPGSAALAWNSIEIIVRPGAAAGAPATVATFPLTAGAHIISELTTSERTQIRRETLPADESGEPRGVRLTGTIALQGSPWRSFIHLANPAEALLAALRELFSREGIAVRGHWRVAPAAPYNTLLLRHASRPLWQQVTAINKYSSNMGAELLARHLARGPGDRRGISAREGVRSLEACLAAWGLAEPGLRIADAAGLSRANRMSAATLIGILRRADRDPSWGIEFAASLPRAGEDGSLRHRLSTFRGRLRAKTGSLQGVSSLAGYGLTKAGRRFAFALLLNRSVPDGGPVSAGIVDRLISALFESAEDAAHSDSIPHEITERKSVRKGGRSRTGNGSSDHR